MKLSAKGRYAVMALADLASIKEQGPVTLAEIAERQDISISYLEQLFAKLRRSGVVKGVRGPGGGYRLSRPACETSIVDIILAVDEQIDTVACDRNSNVGCTGKTGRCLAHDLWDELGRHIYLFLSSVTLDDVLNRRVLGTAGGAHLMESMHQK